MRRMQQIKEQQNNTGNKNDKRPLHKSTKNPTI